MNRLVALALVATGLFAGPAPAGPILFDNSSRADFQSNRGAANSPLAAITVAQATSIAQIGAMVDLNSAGNLRFLIFNLDTQALLFATAAVPFADDGNTFKVSPEFAAFTLNPGVTYGIGAIADVGGLWDTNNSSSGNPFTQNGITASDDRNGNVSNFASPTLGGEGIAMIIVQLFGPTAAVPEPATLALFGALAVGAFGVRRRAKASA